MLPSKDVTGSEAEEALAKFAVDKEGRADTPPRKPAVLDPTVTRCISVSVLKREEGRKWESLVKGHPRVDMRNVFWGPRWLEDSIRKQ